MSGDVYRTLTCITKADKSGADRTGDSAALRLVICSNQLGVGRRSVAEHLAVRDIIFCPWSWPAARRSLPPPPISARPPQQRARCHRRRYAGCPV
eukprot:7383452-Prymnesium_polylepis.1